MIHSLLLFGHCSLMLLMLASSHLLKLNIKWLCVRRTGVREVSLFNREPTGPSEDIFSNSFLYTPQLREYNLLANDLTSDKSIHRFLPCAPEVPEEVYRIQHNLFENCGTRPREWPKMSCCLKKCSEGLGHFPGARCAAGEL